jgi:two-component system nitrogen regulation response regulator GlnG/two-component system response regulator HydG
VDLRISRTHLELSPLPDGAIDVRAVGTCPLLLGGQAVKRGVVRPGEPVTLLAALVLLVVPPRPIVQRLPTEPDTRFPFGAADAHGIIGESPAAWALRSSLAFAGQSAHHVLVLGESGVGKELAARAIHALSAQRAGPFVARNAATFPESLIDAELFGCAKGYPNAGSPERRGLFGEADGGTLFLDEIGELPPALQVHLLRVLDGDGEYQRLGEGRTRRASFRLIAATNRPIEALKHDFAARFKVRVEVPGLDRRREDIPLLLRHLLQAEARKSPDAARRFFEHRGGMIAEARIDPMVIEALLRHRFTLHMRELQQLMLISIATSPDNYLTMTPELREELEIDQAAKAAPQARRARDPDTVGCEELLAVLAASGGNKSEAARRLGLSDRFALRRLMAKQGLKT